MSVGRQQRNQMNPPLPPHDTRLGYIEVSLTEQPLQERWGTSLDRLKHEIEQVVIGEGFLTHAPFSWVLLSIRYGLQYSSEPVYYPINAKYGNLMLSFELDVRDLISATDEEVYLIFKRASLMSLVHAGQKYGRPIKVFERMLSTHGDYFRRPDIRDSSIWPMS
jgi:hypothetical protein